MPQTFSFKFGMSCQGSVSAVKRVSGKMDEEESFDNNMEEQKVSFEGNVQFEGNVRFEAALQTGSETSFMEDWAPPAEPDAMLDAQFGNVRFEAAPQTGSEIAIVEAEAPPTEPDTMLDVEF